MFQASHNTRKNAAAPMIAMLGCPEIDTEVSDAGMAEIPDSHLSVIKR